LFDINVNQRVPLSIDRDNVPASYLKAIFAEVLNITYTDIIEENSSENWVLEATSDKRVNSEAVRHVIEKRFGDKIVIANPFDRDSIDKAISNGYRVIRGSELSKEQWENIHKAEAVKTSTDLFGSRFTSSKSYEPDENMVRVADLAKKIANRFLGLTIGVSFASWEGGVSAQFGDDHLTFNVKSLGKKFFNPAVNEKTIDLIVHEISHSAGGHTEMSYHKAITRLAGELTMLALKEPVFFE